MVVRKKGRYFLTKSTCQRLGMPAPVSMNCYGIRTWSWNARIIRTVSSSRDSRADATSKREADSTCSLQQPCCLIKTMLLPPAGSSGSA